MEHIIENIDIKAIQKGDTIAFKLLFDRYYINLCEYVFTIVKNNHAAEDIVEDVFVAIWLSRENWAPNQSVKSYIFRAAHNKAMNYLKHNKIEKKWEQYVKQRDAVNTYTEKSNHDYSELEKTIYREIEKLPPKRRNVFVLSRFYQLTNKEIAKILDVSVKTVEKHISIALKQLYEKLYE